MFRIVSVLLISSLLLASQQCKPKETIIIVEVEIPCVVPIVQCSFEGMNNVETVSELIRCVYAHREAAKVCQ